jgi:phospholipid/cholesterol/gamma-HCH transport system substrate-binding protein
VVAIGSEGLIGDRLLIITQGSSDSPMAKNGQHLPSMEPVETDAIMASIEISAAYAEIITEELAEIMIKINSGAGTLGQLIQDSTVAQNLNQTIINLKKSSKGLDENMEAVKHNFLLKGFFKKKEREAERLKEEAEQEQE